MARSARELKEENSLESEARDAREGSRALEYSAQPERGAGISVSYVIPYEV